MQEINELLNLTLDEAIAFLTNAALGDKVVIRHPKNNLPTFPRASFSKGYSHFILFSDASDQHRWVLIQEMQSIAQGYFVDGEVIFPQGDAPSMEKRIRLITEWLNEVQYSTSKDRFDGFIVSSNRPHHYFFDQFIHLLAHFNQPEILSRVVTGDSCFYDKISGRSLPNYNESGCYIRPTLGSFNLHLPTEFVELLRAEFKFSLPNEAANLRDGLTIWLGISGYKRRWLDQASGYSSLIIELAKEHKSLHVFIDGMTATTTTRPDVENELEIYQHITQAVLGAFDNVKFTNLIGESIDTKFRAGSNCDGFVAMDGAGLITPLILCDMPGVIHGVGKVRNYQSSYATRKNVLYAYGTPQRNIEIADAPREQFFRVNYRVNWRTIYNKLMRALQR